MTHYVVQSFQLRHRLACAVCCLEQKRRCCRDWLHWLCHLLRLGFLADSRSRCKGRLGLVFGTFASPLPVSWLAAEPLLAPSPLPGPTSWLPADPLLAPWPVPVVAFAAKLTSWLTAGTSTAFLAQTKACPKLLSAASCSGCDQRCQISRMPTSCFMASAKLGQPPTATKTMAATNGDL